MTAAKGLQANALHSNRKVDLLTEASVGPYLRERIILNPLLLK